MIEGMARGCVPAMMSGWHLPPLYQSGVRYQPEPTYGQGLEDFALPLTSLRRKWVDCDDACIWRLGELFAAGEDAQCRCEWDGPRMHVLIRRQPGERFNLARFFDDSRGPSEDPSILLGALRR